jgi:hypothetical protein
MSQMPFLFWGKKIAKKKIITIAKFGDLKKN